MARAVEPHRWIPVSRFEPVDPQSTLPPLEIEVQRGDSLIFVVGSELVQALEDPAREALLAGPEPDVVAGLGVLGPTRMDYPTTMATVRAVASYVSRLLDG